MTAMMGRTRSGTGEFGTRQRRQGQEVAQARTGDGGSDADGEDGKWRKRGWEAATMARIGRTGSGTSEDDGDCDNGGEPVMARMGKKGR